MKSILEKLYYGEISPCSLPSPTSERFVKAKNEVEQLKNTLISKYPNCSELLERFTDAINITSACESEQDFERGFCLGAAIMLAITETE
ncbi:MAG: hypothetical protein IK990_03505 [Ruminiclostridium sp.]|nr:hypothetical protein [Ruminiclostridium sp.]